MIAYRSTAIPRSANQILVAGCGREPQGRCSPPHRHPEGQLLGSSRGLLSIGTDAGVWVVPAIHAVWLPPHQVHWARSHGPMDGWTVYVAEEACGHLPPTACTIRTSGLLREAVLRAATWPVGPRTEADHRVATIILDEISGLPVEPFGLPLPRDPRILRVAQALVDDPADARGIGEWAALASVSERTLSRLFVEETGFNFTTWRQRARLLRSLEMLASGQKIAAIALDLGYATASAFIALFQRVFGESPASYRTKLTNTAL
ncbi:AraC family transcriptional regulator [Burkholderia stagnalis]